MAFDDRLIEDVLKHADIVQVIGSFLPLIKKGKDYKAVCPFHDDTKPSLSITPEKQIFKCFACGTSGNAISFVQKYLHISFSEAMLKVAELSGYTDERLNSQKNKVVKKADPKKEIMEKCMNDITSYYQYALNTEEGQSGLNYFESRNLDLSLRQKYKLGYAFNDGKNTVAFLQSKGHSLKTLEDVGVAGMSNGIYLDKNQGRAIFPICDEDGQVIGFSARKIGNGPEAKYVNSPETYLFHKSNVLYNYHIAKEKAKIANCLYVCEGFMDVFALAKIGMDNAVAIMGTALTQEHIALFRKLNVEIRLCLDGDDAGQHAMMKASKMLVDNSIKCYIVDNNGNTKDPDEILNQDGEEALKAYLNKLLAREDFVLEYYRRTIPLQTSEQKKELIKDYLPILLGINNRLDYDNYLRRLSDVTGYQVDSLNDLIKRARRARQEGTTANVVEDFHPERKVLKKLAMAEREMLYQMIHDKNAIIFYERKINGFIDDIYRQLASFIVDFAKNHTCVQPTDLISVIEASEIADKEQLINELTSICLEANHPKTCTVEYLNELLDSMNKEKETIYEKDILDQSLQGKSDLEKSRIMAEYNRKRIKKMLEEEGEKENG